MTIPLGSSDWRAFSRLLSREEAATSVVITDPNQPDNPVIFVSEEFVAQTGYDEDDVIGRNCRFMQGAGTERAAVDLIRYGLLTRMPFSVDILNYRKSGEPFLNRLRIRPRFDDEGHLTHYVGVQNPL